MSEEFDIYQECKVNKCTEEGVRPNLRQAKGIEKVRITCKFHIDPKSRNKDCSFPLSMNKHEIETSGFADCLVICEQGEKQIICVVELRKSIEFTSNTFKQELTEKFQNTLQGLKDDEISIERYKITCVVVYKRNITGSTIAKQRTRRKNIINFRFNNKIYGVEFVSTTLSFFTVTAFK